MVGDAAIRERAYWRKWLHELTQGGSHALFYRKHKTNIPLYPAACVRDRHIALKACDSLRNVKLIRIDINISCPIVLIAGLILSLKIALFNDL